MLSHLIKQRKERSLVKWIEVIISDADSDNDSDSDSDREIVISFMHKFDMSETK